MQKANQSALNNGLASSQDTGNHPKVVTEKPITEPPKAFEYMGHTVRIEPEIVLVANVETKAFTLAIDGKRLPVLYRNCSYATMDAGRIIWCKKAKAAA